MIQKNKKEIEKTLSKALAFIIENLYLSSVVTFSDLLHGLFEKIFDIKQVGIYSFPFDLKENDHGKSVKEKFELRHFSDKEIFRSLLSERMEKHFFRKVKDFCALSDDSHMQKFEINEQKFIWIYLGHHNGQGFVSIISEKEAGKVNKYIIEIIHRYTSKLLENTNEIGNHSEIERLVYRDDVTGLFNQRKLYKDLEERILKSEDKKETFIVLFIDIDHFKQVNDSYGHIVGTKILKRMGNMVKKQLRDDDLSYRYGGDEFVVILANSDIVSGAMVAHRILKAIKRAKFRVLKKDILPHLLDQVPSEELENLSIGLTVSIGLAVYPEDASTHHEMLKIADSMMYHAKSKGRGRVCTTAELIPGKKLYAVNSGK